jgi:hypothetical protein
MGEREPRQGAVLPIAHNPQLCYYATIIWSYPQLIGA